MRIFVTGATGFVGRNLLNFLVRTFPEASISCLVRDSQKAETQWPDLPTNVQWLSGDLLYPKTYQSALQNAELVFHTAALVSLRNGPEFYTQNTDATRHLVETLKTSHHLKRLLFVGSISAVDRDWHQPALEPLSDLSPCQPNTDYGKSKLQAEQCVMDSGLPYTVVIPAYIYGPYARPNSSMDRLIRDMAAGKKYTRFPFPGFASEVYVEDLAEMLWVSATHANTLNQRYFISNPEPIQLHQAYQLLAEALKIPYKPLPIKPHEIERYRSHWHNTHPDSLVLRILFESYFACLPDRWYQTTGFTPRYGLREGIAKTVQWYRAQGYL